MNFSKNGEFSRERENLQRVKLQKLVDVVRRLLQGLGVVEGLYSGVDIGRHAVSTRGGTKGEPYVNVSVYEMVFNFEFVERAFFVES